MTVALAVGAFIIKENIREQKLIGWSRTLGHAGS